MEVVFEVPGTHFCADQCVLKLQYVPVSPLWDSFVIHMTHLPTPTNAPSHQNPFIFSVQESTKDKCLSSCGAPLWFAVAHLPTPTHPPSHPIPCVSPVHESTIAHVCGVVGFLGGSWSLICLELWGSFIVHGIPSAYPDPPPFPPKPFCIVRP